MTNCNNQRKVKKASRGAIENRSYIHLQTKTIGNKNRFLELQDVEKGRGKSKKKHQRLASIYRQRRNKSSIEKIKIRSSKYIQCETQCEQPNADIIYIRNNVAASYQSNNQRKNYCHKTAKCVKCTHNHFCKLSRMHRSQLQR